MSIKLAKKLETVYVARCQWAVGEDAEGKDIVPFGLLWERKTSAEATNIAVVHGAETYAGGRRYHTWVERVTRYQDGTEESVVILEHNRPAPESETPESGYTPCACRDCMDTTVSSDVSKPELCSECREAGCVGIAPYNEGVQFCTTYECQRDDAYGEC